jgi:hypothetical protein
MKNTNIQSLESLHHLLAELEKDIQNQRQSNDMILLPEKKLPSMKAIDLPKKQDFRAATFQIAATENKSRTRDLAGDSNKINKTLYLKMTLAGQLIDWVEINYESLENYRQRWEHQENVARKLYARNLKDIEGSKVKPEFFIDNVPSKMNEL